MSRVLLLVELKGGNDGLNTVVPYADARYHELRPAIGVARERILPLDERVGLHEKLEPLMDSWKAKDLAILQGVGYPYPNRSHFRSIEIWDTASASTQTLSEGWIAQSFRDAKLPKGVGVDSIVIDTNAGVTAEGGTGGKSNAGGGGFPGYQSYTPTGYQGAVNPNDDGGGTGGTGGIGGTGGQGGHGGASGAGGGGAGGTVWLEGSDLEDTNSSINVTG